MSKTKPPPADHVVSKGKTPEQAGGRPCRHCNSKKHWDFDCPHSDYKKNLKSRGFKSKEPLRRRFKKFQSKFRKAQAKFISADDETWDAIAQHQEAEFEDELSEESDSASESEEKEDSEEQEDF